jgi:uncharacterized protein (TIGR02118 family)
MEQLLLALWRAPGTEPHALLDEWVPLALESDNVQMLSVSVAVDDQPYEGNPVDLVIALGLESAHDLDNVPERDVLYHGAREVEVWRVDVQRPIVWERTWPDGQDAPGVKMVSFMRRAEGLTHQQFVRHWTENHAPLARTHHIGLWNYTQNVVRRAYTPGGAAIDGIAELHFRSRESFEHEFYDSDEGRAIIRADVKRFMAKPGPETALMRERPIKTSS